ncbi:zinc finger protein 501-like [Scomber scombrus]|uniref:zinc finger protein 501-like n=1 Tax=Scomber scombrus TaxID=13677 RepID=UPI002DDA5FCE|nr:zinc finger protein 501-like [Scomber scombrus]
MSTIQLLRSFVSQRLTVAVEEIIGMFEKTITEYEEEIDRHRRLLVAEQLPTIKTELHTERGVSQDIQSVIVSAEVPTEKQGLDEEDPEPKCIKEEQEEVRSSQEGEQFQGLQEVDIPGFQLHPVTVKSEDDEENPQFSRLHQKQADENRKADLPASSSAQNPKAVAVGGEYGRSESAFDLDVAGFLKAASDGQFFLSQCFKTETDDLDDNWNQMIECQPFSVAVKDKEDVSHNRSHNQKKLYRCPACSKTFKHNTALQRHITCHTGERPFDCTECGKKFRQKGSLHIHMRRHTGEKPFCCLVCGKNFTQSGTLAAHMRIHTGEKPFSCSVCKKRYNERGTLVRHMRVHTGEKPFTCTLCGKRFSEKGNLNKHKRIHTGEKPFICSVCEKTFSLLSHLKNHKCPGKKNH